ncbi:MAG: hypothetical protein A2X61_06595 [Ignavibacteria bacterium GWB2_35_12]|nr:MAG: hypothetical protein A2X61_06595 [Ignavibacteria bacterium GWB2_35_12]OGU91527.1 MAG: hypothetical protein A2220_03850 [Ignavibacteria bacterium RIFOXYA2_FULL_35_10]OGV24809.1 MAG: hypothetical protein A2475_01060 [Ignavibacteria bacterium RIFOXYC2_FULL_35_21]
MTNQNTLSEIKSLAINLDTLHDIIYHFPQQLNDILKSIEEFLKDNKSVIIVQNYNNAPPDKIAEFQEYASFITWMKKKFNIDK